jgi:ketosteroid isomerase-like protein
MSQENVQVLRHAYDKLACGVYDPFRDLLAAEVVCWLHPDEPEPGPHVGPDAVMALFGQPTEDDEFVDHHTEAHEFLDAGERVVARVRATGRGRASGAPFVTEASVVHRFHGGRIVEIRDYRTDAEALEAVGLSE